MEPVPKTSLKLFGFSEASPRERQYWIQHASRCSAHDHPRRKPSLVDVAGDSTPPELPSWLPGRTLEAVIVCYLRKSALVQFADGRTVELFRPRKEIDLA
jgi:hypothetical protein